MRAFLSAAAEAGLLLLFATSAMAALFDPAASTLEWETTTVTALLLLGLTRAVLARRPKPAHAHERS